MKPSGQLQVYVDPDPVVIHIPLFKHGLFVEQTLFTYINNYFKFWILQLV